MRLVRSWPARVPAGRARVEDGMERLVMYAYDYTVLGDLDDDVLLLEWDIAVGGEELAAFAAKAATEPDRMLSAPYRLYPGCSIKRAGAGATWAAWRYRHTPHSSGRVEAQPGDPYAHITGLGMTYLPRELIQRYLSEREPQWGFSDIAFCGWHYRRVRPEILLDWSARPVHLHYQLPDIGGDHG